MFKRKQPLSYKVELSKNELVNLLSYLSQSFHTVVEMEGKDYLIVDLFEILQLKHPNENQKDMELDIRLKVPIIHNFNLQGKNIFHSEKRDEKGQLKTATIDLENASLYIHDSVAIFYVMIKTLEADLKGNTYNPLTVYKDDVPLNKGVREYLESKYTMKDKEESFQKFLTAIEKKELIKETYQKIERYRKKVKGLFNF